MESNTEKEVASAMRYGTPSNPHTVSTHEPEMLIKVVDGPEHHQSSMPRRRDHSGACQIEIDVLQHHNPLCDEALRQNIKDLPSEDVQGSYILIDRVPIVTCKNNIPLPDAPVKSALKKTVPVPPPASKFSMHDEHALLRGSRKGTQLNDPDAFAARPATVRNTIENVMLLPKLGCSQPNFVARMEQKLPTKNRYDPSARPATSQKTRPTVVNAASTNQVKNPFDSSDGETTKHSRPSSPQINPQPQQVYSANTSKAMRPFDPCMDPSIMNKYKDPKSKTKVTSVYTTKTDDTNTPFDQTSSKLNKDNVDSSAFNKHTSKVIYHTCIDGPAISNKDPNKRHSSKVMSTKDKLLYKDVDGNVLPQDATPYDTADKKQSVYAVVSKSSRVSFREDRKCDKKPSTLSAGNKTSMQSGNYKNYKDPCFGINDGPVVWAAKIRDPILPTGPTNTEVFPGNDMATMTSFMGCCPPTCDVQVIGKPRENFREESGSEDELNLDPSQQTVATDTVSQLDTASKNPYYQYANTQPPKDGCFKRVFLCGACRKKPAGDAGAPSVVSQPTSRIPSGYAPSSTARPNSGRPNSASTRPPSGISGNRHEACANAHSNNSRSPSAVTGKSAKSHSKQGHNAAPAYSYKY